jgi:lipopolysaccharide export system protein LptA
VFLLNRQRIVAILIGVLLAVSAVAIAQQVKRAGKDVITAQTMDYDWGANTMDFTGNVKVVMKRNYDVTMMAPSMNVKLSPKGDHVASVTANGPVNFEIIIAAEGNNPARKITASAKQQATYAEDTGLVKLVGDAVADLVPVENATEAQTVHFTGQAITANLKTRKLTVDQANLEVNTTTQ